MVLQVPRRCCFVYDPVFSSAEKALVGDLGLQLLTINEVSFLRVLTVVTRSQTWSILNTRVAYTLFLILSESSCLH